MKRGQQSRAYLRACLRRRTRLRITTAVLVLGVPLLVVLGFVCVELWTSVRGLYPFAKHTASTR